MTSGGDGREDDIITAAELVAHGIDPDWARRLPVPTCHTTDAEPYWLRTDLAPWLHPEGPPP